MQDFLIENWRYVAMAAAVAGYLGYDKIKTWLLSLKPTSVKLVAPTTKLTVDVINSNSSLNQDERKDFDAIIYLKNRAVEVKDKELLLEIKNVSGTFFDLHSKIEAGKPEPTDKKV